MSKSPIKLGKGLCVCGAFQMADTYGFPLWAFMDRAKIYGLSTSFPHYFASAIEHGWDDIQTFSKIKEALEDSGISKDFDIIKAKCIYMFMQRAKYMNGSNAQQIAKAMREDLEKEDIDMTVKFAYPKGWIWNPTHLVLNETAIYDTGKPGVNFVSPDGLFEIKDGIAYAYPGIEWDGTTAVPDGGPDPKQPYYPISWKASLFHDLGCKYTRESEEFRKHYTRADWDRYFYNLLVSVNFKHAWLYYLGVRFFGTFIVWKTWIRLSWKKYEN